MTKFLAVAIVVSVTALAVACGSSAQIKAGTAADGGSSARATATGVPSETNPAIDVQFFRADTKLRYFRFVAAIHNPASKVLSGLKIQWVAVDASGAVVGSHAGVMPDIPANADFLYVGGAGSVFLTGTPASVKLTVVSPGKLVSAPSQSLATADISMSKDSFSIGSGDEYTVLATIISGDAPAARSALSIFVVLRDAAGKIVGADFTTADNAPETIPPGTKIRIKADSIAVTSTPASADVAAYVRPTG